MDSLAHDQRVAQRPTSLAGAAGAGLTGSSYVGRARGCRRCRGGRAEPVGDLDGLESAAVACLGAHSLCAVLPDGSRSNEDQKNRAELEHGDGERCYCVNDGGRSSAGDETDRI